MEDIGKIALGIFTGVVTLAIISVVISRKSQTPQVLQAASSALANVVSAAVNPVSTASTNGNLALNTFTAPSIYGTLSGAFNSFGGG